MSKIPYYDSDHRLIDWLSEAKAQKYTSSGAKAVVSRGRIVAVYRRADDRVYASVADACRQMSAAASRYVRRLQGQSGEYISGPKTVEHKRSDV